jgi:hypothetical protein
MTVADVSTGAEHTGIDKPTHVKGIKAGNAKGNYESQAGHNPDHTSTSVRSTGISPKQHGPIDPSMPDLSPA